MQILIERDEEVKRIVGKASQEEHADLEAWERALRAAVLAGEPKHWVNVSQASAGAVILLYVPAAG